MFQGRWCARSYVKSAVVFLLISLQLFPAFAWVFPEHRDIVVLAVQQLDHDRQVRLQARRSRWCC